MMRFRNLLVVLVVAAFFPCQALGQAATIKFTTNPYWTKANDVSAAGQYTFDKNNFTLKDITLHMRKGGGQGYQVPATTDVMGTTLTWSATILGPQNTTYKVYARIRIRQNGTMNDYYYDTDDFQLKAHP